MPNGPASDTMRLRLAIWLLRPYLLELRRLNQIQAEAADGECRLFWEGTIATIDRLLQRGDSRPR